MILALSLTLCTLGAIVAQPSEEWEKTFGGSKDDYGLSVQQTSDGGYIVVGYTSSSGVGSEDVWLIKTSTNGTEEWRRFFGGGSRDHGQSVQQTSDGGYIVVGFNERSKDNLDLWLIKTSTNGTEEWTRFFGGINSDHGQSVQQTSDGGYIVAGYTGSFGSGSGDAWLIKTDSDGNKLWDRTLGGSGTDIALSVQPTSDGGYIVAGYTSSFGAGSIDSWLIKTDSHGNKLWNKTFGGSESDQAKSVQQASDGGYIVAGYTNSFGAGRTDAWLIKTDSHGNKLWNKTFGGSGDDYAESVQQTSDGGYIVAGRTYSFGAGSGDAWLIKTDSAGNEEWNKTFGGSDYNYARDVKETSDGGYILTGETTSHDAGGTDLWLIKVAPVSGAALPKAEKATVAPKAASLVEYRTSDAPSVATGPDDSGEEGSESPTATSDASRPGSGGPLPDAVIERTLPEDYVYSHEISVEGKEYTVYDVFWNGDSFPWTDNDYKFPLVYDPSADGIVTEEDLVEKCLLVEAFYTVAPQDQDIWTQSSEAYATIAQGFAEDSEEAAGNLAKISVLTLAYDGYKTFVFGDVGSAFSITNLLLDSAKNWADPSIVAGPRLQKYLEIDNKQKMSVFALDLVEATVGMASEEVSENPELEESLSNSLKIGGDVKTSYTDLITSITDEVTEPCKNVIRYVELRRTLYLGYLAMLSSQVSSSSDAFSKGEYSYEDVVLYLAADEDIPALSAEMWGFVRDGYVEAQSHFGTAWMVDEDAVSKIDAEIATWEDLERGSSDYVTGIIRTRDFMVARYYENVLSDDSRIRSWPILEVSGVGSDSVSIKNVGSATAENIGLYNNGVQPMLAPKSEIRPGEEISVNLRSDTEYIKIRFSSERVDIVDYLFVP